MSDPDREWSAPERDWNAPGSPPRPGQYGEMAPTPPPPVGPPAYVPPPKPGLIPLYPLSFGRLLGASFAVIRWSPAAAVGWAAIISVLQVVLSYGVVIAVGLPAISRISDASDADRGAVVAGTVAESVLAGLFTIALSLAGTALLQGIVVRIVTRGALGEKARFGQVSRMPLKSFWRLVLYSLIFGGAMAVLFATLVVAVVLLVVFGSTVGIVLAVVIGVLGGLLLLLVYVWTAVQFGLVPSIIVAEQRGVVDSIRRDWRLIKGSFWRTFGLVALVLVIGMFATQIISIPFSLLGGGLAGLWYPNGAPTDDVTSLVLTSLITSVPAIAVSLVVGAVTSVAQASAFTLAYLDIRMRREGLDIELRRVVEDGETTTADPFSNRAFIPEPARRTPAGAAPE